MLIDFEGNEKRILGSGAEAKQVATNKKSGFKNKSDEIIWDGTEIRGFWKEYFSFLMG